jgi:1-acyl-sn-glycerol-3-phosphate acyltransferase
MYELMRLSGQEYVDVYASSIKEKLAAEKAAGKKPHRPGADSRRAAVRIAPQDAPEAPQGPAPGAVTDVGKARPPKGRRKDTP